MKKITAGWVRKRDMVTLAFIIIFKCSVFNLTIISGDSMSPSITKGEWVVVNNLEFSFRLPFTQSHLTEVLTPSRGDVIVFRSPNPYTTARITKRVVGLPGDLVEFDGISLSVNGVRIDTGFIKEVAGIRQVQESFGGVVHYASYSTPPPEDKYDWQTGVWRVDVDELFVIGDNRFNSFDSRSDAFGKVTKGSLIGEQIY